MVHRPDVYVHVGRKRGVQEPPIITRLWQLGPSVPRRAPCMGTARHGLLRVLWCFPTHSSNPISISVPLFLLFCFCSAPSSSWQESYSGEVTTCVVSVIPHPWPRPVFKIGDDLRAYNKRKGGGRCLKTVCHINERGLSLLFSPFLCISHHAYPLCNSVYMRTPWWI